MDTQIQADTLVRDLIRDVDNRRRARAVTRHIGLVAPWIAAAAFVSAAATRLLGLSAVLPLSVLTAGAIGLAGYAVVARRSRAITEPSLAKIDADAQLGGELRSAHWFASRDSRDEWETFHLDRAAGHASAVAWNDLYPPVRARTAWVLTAVLAAGAVALTVSVPGHRIGQLTAVSRGQADDGPSPKLVVLPEDLRKRLAELLAKIEKGQVSADAARAEVADLNDLMSRLDPALQGSLAEFAKRAAESAAGAAGTDGAKTASEARPTTDRFEQVDQGEKNMPQDVKWSLDNLASKLANTSDPGKPQQAGAASMTQTAQDQKGSQGGSLADAAKSGLAVREAAADPAGEMTMAGAGAASGDSRPGAGGNKGGAGRAGKLLDLENALRHETVEAASDTTGANVVADIRRKTEQGQAKVAFTRTSAPATFGQSHAAPPPAVPEARRALLLSYFIRRQ